MNRCSPALSTRRIYVRNSEVNVSFGHFIDVHKVTSINRASNSYTIYMVYDKERFYSVILTEDCTQKSKNKNLYSSIYLKESPIFTIRFHLQSKKSIHSVRVFVCVMCMGFVWYLLHLT